MPRFGEQTTQDTLKILASNLQQLNKSKLPEKKTTEHNSTEKSYKKKMKAIVDSLPIDDKKSIKKIIDEYGTDFPLYAQCQSSDSEEENPWVTALLSLSVLVLDNV